MKIAKLKIKNSAESGIAVYIAVTVTAALILVSFTVMNLVLKQIKISSTAKDSSAAFYSADSGVECALFWDLTQNKFSTSTGNTTIACGGNPSVSVNKSLGAGQAGTSTFAFIFSGVTEPYCVQVAIGKAYVGGALKTNLESRGYNTGSVSGTSCTSTSARRVERAIVVNY